MKRSSAAAPPDPRQIGSSVRALVEAFLHSVPQLVMPTRFTERIEILATNLALWGARMNLTAHPDDPEEVAFHVIDSLMPVVLAASTDTILYGEFAQGHRVLDLGSGAGFPGLVLASGSTANFTLAESRRKRSSFLQVAIADMGLKNVMIEAGRAEDTDLAGQYDLVTARAFGDEAEFFVLAAKALKPGGLAMLYANPSQPFTVDVTRIPYRVARRGAAVERVLAIWKQP